MKSHFAVSRIVIYVAILCTICGLSCKRKATAPGEATKPQPVPEKVAVKPAPTEVNAVAPSVTVDTGPNSVAVAVNGANITEGEVNKLLDMQLAGMAERAPNRSPEFMEQYKKMLRQQTVEAMIVSKLLDEKVKEANIVVKEEEANKRMEEIAATQKTSVEDFKKKLEGYGQNFDALKEQVRKGLTYQKLIEAQTAGKINVTEADANNYYSENLKRFETPEQTKASHILIRPDPNAADPNDAKAKAKATIQELLTKIKGGADLAELAKAHSACPSGANGGDLDFFARGQMEPTFEKVAFEMQPGQLSDIVETSYGYHIIKVTDRKAASVTPFAQVKDQLISQLTQRKRGEFAAQYVQQLRSAAKIVYPPGKEPKAERPAFPAPAPPAPRQ